MDIEKETLTIDLPTNDYLSRCKLSLEFHTVQTILDLVRRVSLVSHEIRAGKQTTTKYDGTWNTMLVDYCFFSLSLSRWNCVSISQRFLFCVTVFHTQLMVFFFIFPLSCIIYPNAECCNIVKHNASWDKIKIMKCIFRKWWALFWSWLEPYRFM